MRSANVSDKSATDDLASEKGLEMACYVPIPLTVFHMHPYLILQSNLWNKHNCYPQFTGE